MLAVRARENDEQEQNDGLQKETLAANIASTMGVIESNAVEVDGTSPGIASLACQIVSSESEITDAAAVRERRRRIPAHPKLNC